MITLHWPTFHCDVGCFRDPSSIIRGVTRVGALVVGVGIADVQTGHSVVIFHHHIGGLVKIPWILWLWVPRRGADQPHVRSNVNLRVLQLNYLRWLVWRQGSQHRQRKKQMTSANTSREQRLKVPTQDIDLHRDADIRQFTQSRDRVLPGVVSC